MKRLPIIYRGADLIDYDFRVKPIRQLATKVLGLAFDEARGKRLAQDKPGRRKATQRKARNWLLNDQTGGLEFWCVAAGIDADLFRQRAREQLGKRRKEKITTT